MTTTVKVEAHCASNKEVFVQIYKNIDAIMDIKKEFILQDGESSSDVVYDDLKIVVCERLK